MIWLNLHQHKWIVKERAKNNCFCYLKTESLNSVKGVKPTQKLLRTSIQEMAKRVAWLRT